MGTLYRVDLRDGAGVRSIATSYDDNQWYAAADPTWGNAPQPSLERLDAFAQIVNKYAPFDVKDLVGSNTTVGQLAASPVNAADTFDVSMLYVFELIGEWDTQIQFILPDTALSQAVWDVSLTADPSIVREDELVDARHASFEVDDWFAVGGKARQVTGLVVNVDAKTGIGKVSELETFPEPRNINLLATFRWLPLDWTIDPWVTYWVPYSGYDPGPCQGLTVAELRDDLGECKTGVQYVVEDFLPGGRFHVRPVTDMNFSSEPGVNPQFLPNYEYYRNGGYVRNGAIGITKGRHLWSDNVVWACDEVTWIAVVVLHQPQDEWTGIMEIESTQAEQLSPYFGIRYHRTGVLGLWADSLLASVEVDSGIARPAQPIVVGLNIDMKNNTCSLLSVDKNVKVQTTSLPHRYDNRSRLWLGRSPFGSQAAANMEILEVSYWNRTLGPGDLAGILGEYDRMYGVTTS